MSSYKVGWIYVHFDLFVFRRNIGVSIQTPTKAAHHADDDTVVRTPQSSEIKSEGVVSNKDNRKAKVVIDSDTIFHADLDVTRYCFITCHVIFSTY